MPTHPKTLLDFAGVAPQPARLSRAVLLLIDVQREYVDGGVPIDGIDRSLREVRRVLDRARAARTPVIHVVHHAKPGAALFDPDGPFVAIPEIATPQPDELVLRKGFPNSFNGTPLAARLADIGRNELVLVGYGTHMCISSTARAAAELGYKVTVVADATGSRDLPDGLGGIVPAAQVHRAHLAGMCDRFATIVRGAGDLLD